MIVVDAGVLVVALVDQGPDGVHARKRLRHEVLSALESVDLEVLSVLRCLVLGHYSPSRPSPATSDAMLGAPAESDHV